MLLGYWLYPDGYAAVKIARQRGKPVVVGARGSDLRRLGGPVSRALVRKTVQGADRVLTVSEDLRRHAIAMGAEPGKVRAILNGCNHRVFHYAAQSEARQELQIPAERRIILFVGWLSASKGTEVLLRAFEMLAAGDPLVHLLFIGEGHDKDITAFAKSHNLESRIQLLGAATSPQVARWMQAVDVLCLPSFSEGCPNVILEASAAGCPVVANAVGGVPEIVTAENGVLIEDHEPQTLAAALRGAMARSWDRQEIARTSTRSWDQVADETFDVCAEAMQSPRRAAAQAPAVLTRRKRPRITVVTPYFPVAEEPYRGHSAFHTLRFMKKDADIHVICPNAVYPRAKLLNPKGFRYRRIDLNYKPPELNVTYFEYPALPVISRPVNGITCARHLEPLLKASRPDVILNYWVYPEGFAAVHLGRRMGVPVVVGSIGSDILRPGDPISFRLMRHTLRAATAVITVSEDLRQNAIRLGVPPDKVTTVLNGCDRSVFHLRDRRQAREAVGVSPEDELLLYIGWISPTKGLVELIESVAALAPRHPRLKLVLIGEGRAQVDFEQQAASAGVADRVLFVGRKSSSEVAQWLAACDVFCLPSHSEGCPNVIVESISCGRPVVATNVGGIPELLNDECGIMVPPERADKLTDALDRALTSSWDYEAIARQFGRGWESAAEETFEACCRAAGIVV
jgi:glycosyltransferase involved in cell wall biosynthesis